MADKERICQAGKCKKKENKSWKLLPLKAASMFISKWQQYNKA